MLFTGVIFDEVAPLTRDQVCFTILNILIHQLLYLRVHLLRISELLRFQELRFLFEEQLDHWGHMGGSLSVILIFFTGQFSLSRVLSASSSALVASLGSSIFETTEKSNLSIARFKAWILCARWSLTKQNFFLRFIIGRWFANYTRVVGW